MMHFRKILTVLLVLLPAGAGAVLLYRSESFPPAFITDGNHGTFDKQAVRLHEKLDTLGVYNVLNMYPIREAQLEHGYDVVLSNKYAADNLEKEIGFLETVLR